MSFALWYPNNILLFYMLLILGITLVVIGAVCLIQDPEADPYLPTFSRYVLVSGTISIMVILTLAAALAPVPPGDPCLGKNLVILGGQRYCYVLHRWNNGGRLPALPFGA